jgi:hypothetical protein
MPPLPRLNDSLPIDRWMKIRRDGHLDSLVYRLNPSRPPPSPPTLLTPVPYRQPVNAGRQVALLPMKAEGRVPQKAGPERTASHFGYVPEPDEAEIADIRREQAEQHRGEEAVDREKRWMLGPIFAPLALAVGSEIAGSIAAREMLRRMAAARGVPARRFEPNRGENPYAAAGRKAHEEFKARVRAKDGWQADEGVNTKEGLLRPDARTPPRNPQKPEKQFSIELKPNTPRGRREDASAKRRYERATDNRTRVIYYELKDHL